VLISALVAAFLAVPGLAEADIIGDRMVVISATDAGGTAYATGFDVPADGILAWTMPLTGGREILDATGNVLATITQVDLTIEQDPAVDLGFVIQAGAASTDIKVTAPTVSFAALSNPDACASAAMTVTDINGNGASVTGLHPGGACYRARYNASTAWADLIPGVSAGANSSNSASGRRPNAGWETIADSVTSIESEYWFRLSGQDAIDTASGTSRFEVTPEPATLGLGALGVAALLARRRR
jgi:MYXO-CTERM domain-containing protein